MEEENENDERYRNLCVEMFLFHHFRFFFVFVSCCLFLTLYAHSAHNTQTISHYDSNSSIYQQHSYKREYLQRFFVNVKGEGDDFALGVQANFKRKIHNKMSSNGS